MEKKTVKYHIPQHGIYMYARTNSGYSVNVSKK